MSTAIHLPALPLPLWRRGKVRDVYEVGSDRLLLVASDRISAFDVILEPPIPRKGVILTQISAWWFNQLAAITPNHLLSADFDEIAAELPALSAWHEILQGRTTLVRRTEPVPVECVVRGYIAGSAWDEYQAHGTLAGEPLRPGMVEADRLDPPLFSPATKATTGHDENISFATMCERLGPDVAAGLRRLSFALYQSGHDLARPRGIIIADTKFEFGLDPEGNPILIDELLTPDSSRFWPAADYHSGGHQMSLDKQPVRDWLAAERIAGRWDGNAPAPELPEQVVTATTERYLDAFRRLTGNDLEESLR